MSENHIPGFGLAITKGDNVVKVTASIFTNIGDVSDPLSLFCQAAARKVIDEGD